MRQEFPLGGAVTVQFVGDDHAGNGGEALEQLPEESLRGFLIPPALHRNIEEMSVLIHRTAEILALTPNGETHFIELPLVARSGTAAPELEDVMNRTPAWPSASPFIPRGLGKGP